MPLSWIPSLMIFGVTFATGSGGDSPEPPKLAAGDTAPSFTLQGSDRKAHRLGDDQGKRVVVLAWFPKAFTGG